MGLGAAAKRKLAERDNVLLTADGRALLIDLEFARPSHALFDAAYWRRFAFGANGEEFRRESAGIDFAWLLGNLAWLLEGALAEDRVWGKATARSRIFAYLERAIRSAEDDSILPRLRELAEAWLADLRRRWPEAVSLREFPAFSSAAPAWQAS